MATTTPTLYDWVGSSNTCGLNFHGEYRWKMGTTREERCGSMGGGDGEDRMKIWMGRPSFLAHFHLPWKGRGTGG
jgi:hypothetical protein